MSRSVLAIDIGSTKICAITADIANDNSITITGAGTTKAQGLKKGSIVNIELAARSIKTAVQLRQMLLFRSLEHIRKV